MKLNQFNSDQRTKTINSFRYKANQKKTQNMQKLSDKKKLILEQMVSTSQSFSVAGTNKHFRTFSHASSQSKQYQAKSVQQLLKIKTTKIYHCDQFNEKKIIKPTDKSSQKQILSIELVLKEKTKLEKLQNLKLRNPFYKIMKKRSLTHQNMNAFLQKQQTNNSLIPKFQDNSFKFEIKLKKQGQKKSFQKQTATLQSQKQQKTDIKIQLCKNLKCMQNKGSGNNKVDCRFNSVHNILQNHEQQPAGIRQKSQTVKYYDIKKYFQDKYLRNSKHKKSINLE